MPYTSKQKLLVGMRDYQGGGLYPSGKYFTNSWSESTPAKESRPKPVDTGVFSHSSTSRSYYSKNVVFSEMGRKAYPWGIELLPVGYLGGGATGPEPNIPFDLHTRIALRIKNQRASLGITLAQYRQLTTMFTSFAGDVLKTANSIRRLRHPQNWLKLYKRKRLSPEVRRIFNSSGKVYLGYQFGFRQFADDFSAVSDALRRRFEEPMYLQDHFSLYLSSEYHATGGSSPNHWISQLNYVKNLHIRYRYRVFPNEQVLAQMGLTAKAVPSLIYDFIPFSFVLNWIIPIGKYLAALDALTGVSDLRWFYTVKDDSLMWNDYPDWGASMYQTTSSLGRTGVQTALNTPFPRFRFSSAANNVLTGVALLGALAKNPRIANSVVRVR